PLFVNNLLPETEVYQEHNTSAAICVEDLKQLILGLSVMYDGAAAFLINLLHATVPENKSNQLWQTQYGDGLKNNVYKVAMNPLFAGHTFIELAWFTYREFGMTLLCVHAWSEADETWHSVLVRECNLDSMMNAYFWCLTQNPSKYYKLTERDELVFIAHNAVDVELFVALVCFFDRRLHFSHYQY
ncbi:calcium-activated BK potassium channel alpha subunit-domain-containing protein, partial [Chytriomyces sp. MP71]